MQEDASGKVNGEKGKVQIASHSPGRLRLKLDLENPPIPDLDQLLRIPAVTEVAYRKLTGSLLIYYDQNRCSLADLLVFLGRHFSALNDGPVPARTFESELPRNFLSSAMYYYAEMTNEKVHSATSGRADLTSIFPVIFFSWAVVDLILRPSLPRWFELYREGSYLWHFYQQHHEAYRE